MILAKFDEIVSAIQEKLDSSKTDKKKSRLESVNESFFVVAEEDLEDGKVERYSQPFVVINSEGTDENDTVKWDEKERVSVDGKMQRTNKPKGGNNMKEKIDKLLAMAKGNYSEEDRVWLEKMEEVQIDKLLKCAQAATDLNGEKEKLEQEKKELEEKVQANEKEDGKENGKEKDGKEEPEVNEAKKELETLKKNLSDPEEFKKMIPETMREQFDHGQRLIDKEKGDLIKHILDNQASKEEGWSKEELEKMPMTTLEKTAKSIPRPVDYSGQGSGTVNNSTEEEPLLPPEVLAAQEAEKKAAAAVNN